MSSRSARRRCLARCRGPRRLAHSGRWGTGPGADAHVALRHWLRRSDRTR
jgi:hypothetical protein